MAQNELQREEVREYAERATRHASPWLGRLARLGYVAKGVVYLVIGFLALCEALGGGKTADPGGAMKIIGSQPFGGVMLALLAVGLACYALWKLVQGVLDADGKASVPTASCGAWATWGAPRSTVPSPVRRRSPSWERKTARRTPLRRAP